MWSGNNKNILDTCQHEDRQRIVNHWFIVNRDKLFGKYSGQGIESGAGPAGKDYAFHIIRNIEEWYYF